MKQYVIEQLTAEEFYELIRNREEAAREEGFKEGLEAAKKSDWIGADEAMKILGCRRTKLREFVKNQKIKTRRNGKEIQYSRDSCVAFDEKKHAISTQKQKRPFRLRP